MKLISCLTIALAMTILPLKTVWADAVPKQLEKVHRIVCLGDSITQGGEGPGGYVWLVRHTLATAYSEHPIEVVNAGISGHKSTDMLARFQRDVSDKKPDLVTISVGVNDVWHAFRDFAHNKNYPDGSLPNGVPLDQYKANVEKMVVMAEEIHAQVVLLSTTVIYEDLSSPENARLVGYNKALKEIANRHHATFVDYQKPFQSLIKLYRKTTGLKSNFLTGDGVHMNGSGNQIMARELLKGLGVTEQTLDSLQDSIDTEVRQAAAK